MSNSKTLNLLIKPLHLFLAQDVEGTSETKAAIAQEWQSNGLYYVAQLLASSSPVAFIPAHIALKKNGFKPAQLAPLKYLLPQVKGSDSNMALLCYERMKPQIYSTLGTHAELWADMNEEPSNKAQESRTVFSVHFDEQDLLHENIDVELAEKLFEDPSFRLKFSDLMRQHAMRIKSESLLSS